MFLIFISDVIYTLCISVPRSIIRQGLALGLDGSYWAGLNRGFYFPVDVEEAPNAVLEE